MKLIEIGSIVALTTGIVSYVGLQSIFYYASLNQYESMEMVDSKAAYNAVKSTDDIYSDDLWAKITCFGCALARSNYLFARSDEIKD